VLRKHLGNSSRRTFGRIASSLAVERRRAQDTTRAAQQRLRSTRTEPKKYSGWDEFKRTQWNPVIKPFSVEGFEERKRLRDLWLTETVAQRGHYDAQASVRSEAVRQHAGDTLGSPSVDCGGVNATKVANRRRMVRTLDAVRNDSAWICGSRLDQFNSPLEHSKFDSVTPDAAITARLKTLFHYDEHLVDNPNHSMVPETACCAAYGGCCETDEHIDKCVIAVRNIHTALRSRGISKQ